MKSVNKGRVQYFPLKALLGFLVFTEILLFLGPIDYSLQSPILLIIYLIILNVAFYWGYRRGVSHYRPSQYHFRLSTVHFLIIVGFILNVFRLFELWSRRGLSVSLSTIVLAIINPGEVYYAESMDAVTSSLITTLLSPITWAVLPIGLYKWKNLNFLYRLIIILTIIVQIVTWLGIGTRKGLLDLILIISFVSYSNYYREFGSARIRKRTIIGILIAVVAFVFYFIISNLSRYGLSASEINQFEIGHKIRPFYEDAPYWLLVTLNNIEGYLCQGYYALSIALSEGIIVPTFLGISWFTMVIASKFGYNPMPNTYLSLLEKYGIDSHVKWHTIYVWLANDFTFIGVPIIIYLIGLMFARTWCDSVKGDNDTAIPLFTLLLVMVFYFFANNQVLSFSFVPFVVWWLLYRLSRIK